MEINQREESYAGNYWLSAARADLMTFITFWRMYSMSQQIIPTTGRWEQTNKLHLILLLILLCISSWHDQSEGIEPLLRRCVPATNDSLDTFPQSDGFQPRKPTSRSVWMIKADDGWLNGKMDSARVDFLRQWKGELDEQGSDNLLNNRRNVSFHLVQVAVALRWIPDGVRSRRNKQRCAPTKEDIDDVSWKRYGFSARSRLNWPVSWRR